MSMILVCAPHPNDEVLGCGGSIAGHVAAGRHVHVAHMSSGEHGVPGMRERVAASTREREARAAARVLGVDKENLTFLRLPDGGFDAGDGQQFAAVLELLRRLRPDAVYLPHPGDGSFDHRRAHRLVWRALEMCGSRNYPRTGAPHWVGTVLGYEVRAPITSPTYLEDIEAATQLKVKALACYGSQDKGPGQAEHCGPGGLALSRCRGAMTIGGHREAFAVLRLKSVAW